MEFAIAVSERQRISLMCTRSELDVRETADDLYEARSIAAADTMDSRRRRRSWLFDVLEPNSSRYSRLRIRR